MKKIIYIMSIILIISIFSACDNNTNVPNNASESGNKNEIITNVDAQNDSGTKIDLIVSGETIDREEGLSSVDRLKDDSYYSDNICLLLGYVIDDDEKEFIDKYFVNDDAYYSIKAFTDYTDGLEKDYVNKFVFLPKDENVQVAIYTCNISDEGELIKDREVVNTQNEPFVFYFFNVEPIMPQYIATLKVADFEDEFPLVFSGKDGTVSLVGHESEILDISIYHDLEED